MQTPISQTPYFTLVNPKVFPEPDKFDPYRWIKAAEEGYRLDKYLVAFSKGSRICLGMK